MKRALLLFLVCFCAPAWAQDNVFGRTDTQKEIELGREAYDSLLRSGRLSRNEAYIRRVNRVFSQLVAALPEKLYAFQVVVVAENDLNAGCWPGGYILVNEGTLTLMPDDNQLAFVLAHEIGHGARRHFMREMRKAQSAIVTQTIISILLNTSMNDAAIGLARLRFSREHENEADEFGTELYIRAGFDPKLTSAAMRTMADQGKGRSRPPEYLLTHPDPERRLKNIEATCQRLLDGGLKPVSVDSPDLSVEAVFGKIPAIAPQACKWMSAIPGEVWEYEVSGGTGGNTSYRLKAIGASTIGSTSIMRMELNIAGSTVPYQMILDGDRIWRRNRPKDQKSAWTLEAVMPAVGESEGDEARSFYSPKLETVETPAGKFEDCLLVKEAIGTRILHSWYAPGIGLVKRLNPATGVTEVLASHKRP